MRKLLIALVLLLGMVFLLARVAALNEVWAVLLRGNVLFLGLALLVEAAWIYNLGAFFQSIYRVLGLHGKRLHVMKLVTAGYFLSVVAPSAGFSAVAVYIDDARRRNLPTARVTVATVLYTWFELVGTMGMTLLGLAALARRHDLYWSEITASLILMLEAIGIGMILYLGMRSATALGKMLAFLSRMVNFVARPLIHRTYLSENRAHEFAAELVEGIKVLGSNPRWILRPLLLTITNKILLVTVLAFCFMAFEADINLGTLVAGQSIAHLFQIVSPTPAGIGVVEGVMALSLGSVGVPLSDATVITLAYRAFSFWTPFFFGMLMFRVVGKEEMHRKSKASRRWRHHVHGKPAEATLPYDAFTLDKRIY